MEQFTSWAETLVEQGAVALGLLSEEEVAKDSEVSSAELRRRFSTEACDLKAPSEAPGGFFGCGSSPEIDRHGAGYPSGVQCETALRLWLGRLTAQSHSAPTAALEAMLQSQALNVSLMAMSRSKAGRETIHQAVRSGQGKSDSTPLWEILRLASAAPAELLVRLVRFLHQSADQLAQSREQGVKHLQGREQMLQWTVTLICSSLSDAQELALYRDGHPAEVFQSVEEQLAEGRSNSAHSGVPGSSEQLDALEKLGTTFQALRTVCDDLVASRKKKEKSKKNKESGNPAATQAQVPENTLSAMISCLAVLRLENAIVGSRTDQDAELTDAVRAASLEVEALLKVRLQRVTQIGKGMAELPDRLEDAGAAGLQLEQLRRRCFDEFLEGVKQKVWDSDAHSRLGGDATLIAAEREIIKRGIGLVDLAWREMVGLAAESLDDNNVMGANSEEMSNAAKHYKDMREELKSSMVRLSKLEAEGPPNQKASAPSAKQAAAKPLGASAARQLAVAQKPAAEASAASAAPASSKAGAVKAGPPAHVSSGPGSATVPTKASQPVKEAAAAKATASMVPAKSPTVQSSSAPERVGMADAKAVTTPLAKAVSKEVSTDTFAGIGHVTVVVTQASLSSPWESAVSCDVMELRDHLRQMLGRNLWPDVVFQAAASGSGCGIAITGTTEGGPVKVLCSGPDAAAVKGQLGACQEVVSPKTASTAAVAVEAIADVESAMILLTRASAANIWEMAVSPEVLELRERVKQVTGGGDVPAVVLQREAQPGKSEDSCAVVACSATSKAAQIMCSGPTVAAVHKQFTVLTK